MNIVDLDKFYDRKDILDLLKKRILDLKEGYRQNVAFLGNRYIGKSIILQKFISDLSDAKIVPIYLDLENQDLDIIYEKIAGAVLFHYVRIKGLPLTDNIKSLLEVVKDELPQTHRAIKRTAALLAHNKKNEAFRDMILLPQIYAKEADAYCALFLDEFQSLQELPVSNIFQELGKKIMTQKRCLYIVTSSFPIQAKKILAEKLSLLFGNFEVIYVYPYDLKTSRDFIAFCLEGLKISEPIQNFLVDFTGGHPLFIRLICQELLSLAKVHQQDEIFMPLLHLAIENVLFNPWGVLGRHFDLLIENLSAERGHHIILKILYALTQEKHKVKELAQELNIRQTQVTQKLICLIEQGLVVKNGSFYYLCDKLMRFWLKYVFQIRQQSFDFNLEQRQVQFRNEMDHLYEDFQLHARKDLSTRIVELLNCFDEETFFINGRRYQLPLFHKVIASKLGEIAQGCLDVIRGIAEDGEWVIVFKPESVCENDINLILSESRKYDRKPRRCILISLSDIDENTRIKALQERMWIWSEGELNALLNMFNKPFITQPGAS